MKKLVCKVCGGSDLLKCKDYGYCYCLGCEMEYTWDEAHALEKENPDTFHEEFMEKYDYYYAKHLAYVSEMEMEEHFSEYSEPDWERLMITLQ